MSEPIDPGAFDPAGLGLSESVTRIGPGDSGVFTVITRTSTYLIDLDAMTLLRAPGVGSSEEADGWLISTLRRDSEEIPLLEVAICETGESAQFWVQASDGPNVRTLRVTTPVVEISKIG